MKKEILGFPGYYIEETGQIWSEKSKCYRKLTMNKGGYLYTSLRDDNGKSKIFLIHRLVAQYFIPNPNNLPEVNHINEDKTDNRVENLEWCTTEYNLNYGTRLERMRESATKKRGKKVKCLETQKIYPSMSAASREIGLNVTGIWNVCKGKQKTCGGYTWEYVTDNQK